MTQTVTYIGTLHTPYENLTDCPRQGYENGKEAWIDIAPEYAAAMDKLYVGLSIDILTWLHKADRSVLSVHPRGDTTRPLHGVFGTRSPARPNPIGLHTVTILGITGTKLLVGPIEVLDGTPVIDIKLTIPPERHKILREIRKEDIDTITSVCARAWHRHLYSGFNGNASIRIGDTCLMTTTGSAKGSLEPKDFVLVDIATGEVIAGGVPSSEGEMHLEIYRNQPEAQAVLHTHPPDILALGVLVEPKKMLKLPIYETDLIGSRMTTAPAHEPGTKELAIATGKAATTHDAIYMEKHGLVCWADSLSHALSLSEELEHLAGIHVNVLQGQQ